MFNRTMALVCLAVLAGCSQEVMSKSEEYGIAFEVIETSYGTFRVYEHPSGERAAVASTLGEAIGQGIVSGLTLGAADVTPSEGAAQEALEVYLARHKSLSNCYVTNGYLLQRPLYEFTLRC